jgi:dopamine beta-monooxygenase
MYSGIAYFTFFTFSLKFSTAFSNISQSFELITPLNDSTVHLSWTINWDIQSIDFDLSLTGRPVAWVLVGFSDHGLLENTDFCLYKGKAAVEDGWIDNKAKMVRDIHQDCEYVAHSQMKQVIFRRKFVTCDPRDYAIEPGTTNILLATGVYRERVLTDATVVHTMRYTQLLQSTPIHSSPKPAKHVKLLDLTATKALIPSEVTTYWCAVVKLDEPLRQRKHHIVKV